MQEALVGRFRDHHALMIRLVLEHTAYLEAAIADLDAQIDRVIAPFAEARDHLDSITGVGKRSAEVIIAEIGADMSVFSHRRALGVVGGDGSGGKTSPAANADRVRPPRATCGWPILLIGLGLAKA